MLFAIIGVGVLAPFALAMALLLSMQSHADLKMKQIHQIADDWQKYLDNFDTGSNYDIRHGSAVSNIIADDCRAYRRFDDVLARTK